MKKFHFSFLLCLAFANFSCQKHDDHGKETPVYQTNFTIGSTNNRLEILDWGGKGRPILFLTGLGNTAHVFYDFAPKFRDKFHVYVMSRRGYGGSEQTAKGYDPITLADDLLAVTKFLQLNRVILIGHSISGEEVSKFASSYPDRVEKIIYLDAAYDRTVLADFHSNVPDSPEPETKDSASFLSVKAYMTRTAGVSMPDDELRHSIVFSNDGRYQRHITPGSIDAQILAGVQKPDYRNIKCPALAIYSVATSATQLFPFYSSLDAENKKRAETAFVIFQKYGTEQRAIFQREVIQGIEKGINGANHYVFISHPIETEKYIRDFLQ